MNRNSQDRLLALRQGLQQAGWAIGRNLQIDVRWSGGDPARLRKDAAELVAGGSDLIVAPILHQASRTVPIVMAQAVDPVGAGFVQEPSAAGR